MSLVVAAVCLLYISCCSGDFFALLLDEVLLLPRLIFSGPDLSAVVGTPAVTCHVMSCHEIPCMYMVVHVFPMIMIFA